MPGYKPRIWTIHCDLHILRHMEQNITSSDSSINKLELVLLFLGPTIKTDDTNTFACCNKQKQCGQYF